MGLTKYKELVKLEDGLLPAAKLEIKSSKKKRELEKKKKKQR